MYIYLEICIGSDGLQNRNVIHRRSNAGDFPSVRSLRPVGSGGRKCTLIALWIMVSLGFMQYQWQSSFVSFRPDVMFEILGSKSAQGKETLKATGAFDLRERQIGPRTRGVGSQPAEILSCKDVKDAGGRLQEPSKVKCLNQ